MNTTNGERGPGRGGEMGKVVGNYLAGRFFRLEWAGKSLSGGLPKCLHVDPYYVKPEKHDEENDGAKSGGEAEEAAAGRAADKKGREQERVSGESVKFPATKVVVAGLDIKEYSTREPEEQLALEIILFASVEKALEILRKGGAIGPDAPLCLTNTGDGVRLVFGVDSWTKGGRLCRSGVIGAIDQAFAFVLTLNAMICEDNRRQTFQTAKGPSLYPVFVRFAVAFGDVLVLQVAANSCAVIGDPIVACARILSDDSGNHFLMQDTLQAEVDRNGGMGAICHGEWDQRFHFTTMREVRIKKQIYRYVDIFGHYNDAPVLRMLRRDPKGCRLYHIGSHDVGQVGILRGVKG